MQRTKTMKKPKINYFSDLFVAVMVVGWLVVIIFELAAAIYSTVVLCETDIWSTLTELVGYPLMAGGGIWMIKNTVQHAIANNRGEQAHMDFPKVDDTEMEQEEQSCTTSSDNENCG